jgi:transposase
MRWLLCILLGLVLALAEGFTIQEKARYVLLYERNCRQYKPFKVAARNDLRDRGVIAGQANQHTDALIPARSTMISWIKLFEETGSLGRRPYSRERSVLTNETLGAIERLLEETPIDMSQRRIANALNISQHSVNTALRQLEYHPYKLQLIHELSEEDYATRAEFCLSQLESIETGDLETNDLLFSDEAMFHLHGGVNRHNFRYYAKSNPRFVQESPIVSPHVHVWAGVSTKGAVGPFFFTTSVNSSVYGTLLNGSVAPALEELYGESLGEGELGSLVFQQDGAPPHFGGLNWLDENFPERWMGRGTRRHPAPYPWPPRSPDLTVMDFFFWGYLKSKLYGATPYRDLQSLRDAITRETAAVPLDMIQRSIRQGYVNRLKKCVLLRGRQVEVYGVGENEREDETAEDEDEPMPDAPEAPSAPTAPAAHN